MKSLLWPTVVLVGAGLALVLIQSDPSSLELSRVAGIYALLALSVGISYGQAGILSLGQAAFASVGAYGSAIVTTRYEWNPWAGMVLAMALAAGLAYVLARLLVRLSALALALATLLFGELVHFALTRGGDLTGGYIGLPGIEAPAPLDSREGTHLVVWAVVALVVLIATNISTSAEGRTVRGAASDPVLAGSLGVAVPVRLSAVFALSGAVAGLAGFLFAHSSGYLAPESLSIEMSIAALAMAVIGGRYSPVGPVVGALVVVLALDLLPSEDLAGLFYGLLIIAAIVLLPRGLLGIRRSTPVSPFRKKASA
ncbi:branched-chain amino acid ABC transporter permease [Aeromicrobium sp. Leaf350]|uniref:branched-chain amino acid ABC transporter permease n=1 Tax=Aeromicrobium sp. Leaf350 TaxID=2876565 RepID=UPI001E55B1EF|nr:branched-chain amino acid ABC transporter permease [Aeromicrobium sp. Leaf350]